DATGWDGDPRTGWREAYGIGLSGVEIHARYGVLCHRITWAATSTGSPNPCVFFPLFVSRTGRDTRIRPISRSSSAARTDPDLDAASYDDSPRIGWQNAHGIGLSRVGILAPARVLSQRVALPVAATGRPIPGSHFRFSPQERGVARKYGPLAGLRQRRTDRAPKRPWSRLFRDGNSCQEWDFAPARRPACRRVDKPRFWVLLSP